MSSTTEAFNLTSAEFSATILDLVDRVLRAKSAAAALRAAADGLRELHGGEFAAAALPRRGGARIEVVTHLESFHRNSELVLALEAACRTPSGGDSVKGPYVVDAGAPGSALIVPFSADGRLVAIGIVIVDEPDLEAERLAILELVSEHLGPALDAKLHAASTWNLRRLGRSLRDGVAQSRRYCWAIAAAVALVGFIPAPYKVRCDVELQPVVERHIAAPFDGVLERSFVKPGDVVVIGQPLGRLDQRELQYEIVAATAERDRAAKSRDVNMAAGKTAAAQIDRLEAQRIDERLKLLKHRLDNLDIKSPIAGVVLSGNLDRAEGAPVKIGQSLFEIAPLDQMVAEVLVPEAEIEHVKNDQDVYIALDSVPTAPLNGRLSRVHPRADLRDGENIFVAEAPLENGAAQLRPGMKGTAEIVADRRPLALIVWHRANEVLSRLFR